jgi:plastocyanin
MVKLLNLVKLVKPMASASATRWFGRVSLSLTLSLTMAAAAVPRAGMAAPPANWPGDDMPLPVIVKTPEDLAFKNEAERQYAIFNLMTSGKLAYEQGDYARAARKWEALLKVPNLPGDVTRVVRPLFEDARQAAASGVAPEPRAELDPRAATPAATASAAAPSVATTAPVVPEIGNVSGTVLGGGSIGPGGAVLWMKRLDGPTPSVRPLRKAKVVGQRDKVFIPRVVAVPVGSKVDFRNDDPYYHNVFSLSEAEKFDTGLYASGLSYTQTFEKPGPVELLCNIHAAMIGYVVVVDTPYYTQPRGNGAFTIRNVPPGRYELSTWHEASAHIVKQTVQVREGGASGVTVKVPNDRVPKVVVPDKYGKPRQPQLGY